MREALRERLRRTAYKMPERRWAAIFVAAAPAILDIVLLPPRVSKDIGRRLESMCPAGRTRSNPTQWAGEDIARRIGLDAEVLTVRKRLRCGACGARNALLYRYYRGNAARPGDPSPFAHLLAPLLRDT